MQHVHLASEINGRSISLGSEEGEGEATKAGYQSVFHYGLNAEVCNKKQLSCRKTNITYNMQKIQAKAPTLNAPTPAKPSQKDEVAKNILPRGKNIYRDVTLTLRCIGRLQTFAVSRRP